MSSFSEAAMAEIEALFANTRQGRFITTQQAVTPYESPIGPGQINPVGFIAPGALSRIDLFADTIRPPVVVTSLPALPDVLYPVGSFAFLTTDAKLYRNTTGSAWSATIASSDITGHVGIPIAAAAPVLPDTTYPAGSYYWNNVSLALFKTANGTTWIKAIEAVDIVANTITAGQIAAATITTTEIAALTITAANIATDTITAGQIAAGAIATSELAASAVTAAKIAAGAVLIGNMASPPNQSVTNGGFEIDANGADGSQMTGWEVGTGVAGGFFIILTSPKYGDKCLQLAASAVAVRTLLQSQFIPVEGGRPYKLEGWSRGTGTNNAGANTQIGVAWYDSSQVIIGAVTLNAAKTVGTSTTWVESNEVQTAPATAVYAKVRCHAAIQTAGNFVYFDAINLYRADEDLYHGGGNVTITSAGIVITNGYLTLSDQFGNNVLTGAGFGASWLDFIASGFYNDHFQAGTTNNIVAATLVGTASTDADYLASLSTDIPYWVVAAESGAGTLKRVSDAAASGGFALEWDGTENATIFQDVPVIPARQYSIGHNWKISAAGDDVAYTISYQFRTSVHAAIGSQVDLGLNQTTDDASYIENSLVNTTYSPANARFLRVSLQFSRSSGSPTVRLNTVHVATSLWGEVLIGTNNAGADSAQLTLDDTDGKTIVTTGALHQYDVDTDANASLSLRDKALIFGAGGASAQDTYLYRSATKVLTIDTDGALGALTAVQLGGATPLKFSTDAYIRRSATKTLTLDSDGAGTALTAVILAGATPLKFSTDAYIRRSATKTLTIDTDGAGGMLTSLILAADGNSATQLDITGTTAGTGIRLGSDTNLYRLAANSLATDDKWTTSALEAHGGTSFPASPATNDLFYRTDLGGWYYYDGTRWLSEQLYSTTLSVHDVLPPLSATGTPYRGSIVGLGFGLSIYLITFNTTVYVSGGTALSGSHKWVGVLVKVSAANADTTIATATFNSGSSSVWRNDTQTPLNVVVPADHYSFSVNWTKTGTPGNLYVVHTLNYRLIAT